MSKSCKTLRFALGTPERENFSIWRFWINKNDIYLAVRSIAGYIKTSLHETGSCQTSFTKEYAEEDDNIIPESSSRHIKQWHEYQINTDLSKLFSIVIPHRNLKRLDVKIKKPIYWIDPLIGFNNTQFTVLKSRYFLGENNWIGKRAMNTKLLNFCKLENSQYVYVVYHGQNDKVRGVKISTNVETDGVIRSIMIGVDNKDNVGYLIDS